MSETKFRYRAVFSKNSDMRFIGHLDLQQLIEHALRRSGLPLRYSQGFSPKVRLNLAGALPLGFTSTAEMMDIWLDQPVEPPLIQRSSTLPCQLAFVFYPSPKYPTIYPACKPASSQLNTK